MKNDCCWKNLEKAVYVSKTYWICPLCGSDVSRIYVMMMEELMENSEGQYEEDK